jgi:hypothetical protein
MAFDFRADSRLVPLLAAVPGLACASLVFFRHIRGASTSAGWLPRSELIQVALLTAAIAAIHLVGFFVAVGAYVLILLATRTSLRLALLPYTAAIVFGVWGISRGLRIPLP